jgi:hypothetical protein
MRGASLRDARDFIYGIAAPATAAAGDSLSLIINIALHGLGSAIVIAALQVRQAEQWIEGQL